MDIADLLSMAAKNPQMVAQLGSQFGLNQQQTSQATNLIMQALAGGFQNNLNQPDGPENLAKAIETGDHQKYVEQPETLETATSEGNAILGHVLGSKDMSRTVAAQVGQRTNVQSDLVKQMLPVMASMAMGMLSKNIAQKNAQSGGANMMSMLNSMLDTNRNGTAMDEIMQMVMNARR